MKKTILFLTILTTLTLQAREIKLFGTIDSQSGSDINVVVQDDGEIIEKNYQIGDFIKKGSQIALLQPKKAEALNGISGYKLKNIKIETPISGYVVNDFITKGMVVNSGTKIARVVSDENRFLSIAIPNDFASKITKDQDLEVLVNGKKIQTKISKIIPISDPSNNTFQAYALVNWSNAFIGSVYEVLIQIKE